MEQQTTISDFESVCEQIKKKREEIDAMKAQVSQLNKELGMLENKAQAMLENNDITSYKSKSGTVYVSYYESVKMPQTLEDKAQFFTWLKERDLYDSMVTVNSQSLNSLYRKEKEAAEENGDLFFKIPGLNNITTSPRIGFRKG